MLARIHDRGVLRDLIHFAAVGLMGTLVQYMVLWVGVEKGALSAPVASAVGYIFGAMVNYTLNYFFTFASKKSHKETALKYIVIVGSGWLLNGLLMSVFVIYWNWYYWVAQFFTTGCGLMWNFAGSKWWVFHQKVA